MLLKLQKKSKGFTLIELMIVVAITGILAAIAIPNFLRYQQKAKQAEAKANLGAIFTSEVSYYGENNVYAARKDGGGNVLLNWAPTGTTRYAYSVSGVSSTAFLATAAGTISSSAGAPVDTWTIDQTRTLTNTINGIQ